MFLKPLITPQPPDGTPFKMDNKVSHGFIHSNIKLKRSKSWDMRFHWLRDKANQKHFRYYWSPGILNNADYFTKHHPPNVHKKLRSTYILQGHNLSQCLFSVIQSHLSPLQSHKHHPLRRGCVDQYPVKLGFPQAMTSVPLTHQRMNLECIS